MDICFCYKWIKTLSFLKYARKGIFNTWSYWGYEDAVRGQSALKNLFKIRNSEKVRTLKISSSNSENPVEDLLKFSITYRFNDNMVIELYDIQGKLIRQLTRDRISNVSGGTKNYEFSVGDLSSGMYILNFHNNTGRQSLKFIKK